MNNKTCVIVSNKNPSGKPTAKPGRVIVGFEPYRNGINFYSQEKDFMLIAFRVFFNQHFILSALDAFNEALESVAFGNVNDGFQTFLSQ